MDNKLLKCFIDWIWSHKMISWFRKKQFVWLHFTITRDGLIIKCYINGKPVNQRRFRRAGGMIIGHDFGPRML